MPRIPTSRKKIPARTSRIFTTGFVLGLMALFATSALIVFAERYPDSRNTLLLTTSVDPIHGSIAENSNENTYFDEEPGLSAAAWHAFDRSGMRAALLQAYQSIIRPGTKVVIVHPGLRKEEVAGLFATKLSWDEATRAEFLALTEATPRRLTEGYLYPDTYYVASGAGAEEVHEALATRFEKNVSDRYTPDTSKVITLDLALKIASLIQREAAGAHDMRLVSGVIWNRLFQDMTLDIDATLQYAKGSEEDGWWPRVVSDDKYIDSPFNTYRHGGVPPTPIANPSVAAIYAALNPQKTDAIFYLHDPQRKIRLARTYKEHVANIRKYY
ncbi:MAG: hypothetical protein COV10_02455 [Candidatus Vogelbacteria bacterium CG10_big_fil_rev_8_21_14_0_10_51_16]|uniref:Endolytic murein transglycosylase n=1 Tax=Candidatus Vogelbacteria bacterium CG10_big_fil_rev_8_21_14_0_10_51_16 TaxID=1975045 RepID=A0A2H0RE77_9BACT|nr:MAG: hypothetical protein COV10_02455 [Candidatus Vogelbacteria bacterium CG10_big_fil_rev_8_21_14_0_10_51_16]